ncbi:uncharacterized protein KGF55_001661 [Candida pseudojiufengensis]|uniref:uncharacterized protein n=1 Tax=Candida pseudojiufengensis TaxID=497109 RepID=UPI002223EF5B|nr:uncharacterized protein KGF55_001661 [Candida pseudojiufengensis]KAI5964592.1 hypothetical protein KGF55_001661 [Candida pseudojiufengensis]
MTYNPFREQYNSTSNTQPTLTSTPIPSLFKPFKVSNTSINLKNHIAVSSMCSFAADNNHEIANLHHSRYKSFASQKPSIIMFEGTFINSNSIIDDKELGIWNDEQAFKIKEIVDEIHSFGCICFIQLFHGGRMAKGLNIVAPSSIPYDSNSIVPKELNLKEIAKIRFEYLEAAKRSINICGFDGIEIACCNGNLLHQFQSKITNHREDEYGKKTIESRIKLLCEIIDDLNNEFNSTNDNSIKVPISVKFSINDNIKRASGIHPIEEDIMKMLKILVYDKKISILNITSGKISPNSKLRYTLNRNSNIPAHIIFSSFLKKEFSNTNCLIGCSGALNMNIPKLNDYIEKNKLDIAFIGEGFLEDPNLIESMAIKLNYLLPP